MYTSRMFEDISAEFFYLKKKTLEKKITMIFSNTKAIQTGINLIW